MKWRLVSSIRLVTSWWFSEPQKQMFRELGDIVWLAESKHHQGALLVCGLGILLWFHPFHSAKSRTN